MVEAVSSAFQRFGGSWWAQLVSPRRLKETAFSAMADRCRGLLWATQKRHRTFDVVEAYEDQLKLIVASRESRLGSEKGDIEARIDALTARIGYERQQQLAELGAKISDLNSTVEVFKAEQQRLGDPEGEARKSYTEALKDFSDWKAATGRPPFSENFESITSDKRITRAFDIRVDPGQDFKMIDPRATAEDKETVWSRARKSLSNIALIFTPIAVPIEVVFTFPSFQFLLEGASAAAWAASLLFTLALVLLGYAIGSFTSRMKHHKLVGANSEKTIEERWNYWMIVITACLFVFAFYCTSVAASLRSLVPQINELNQRQARLEQQVEGSLGGDNVLGQADPTGRKAVEEELRDITRLRQSLFEQPFRFYHSTDGHVAFAIYLILIFSSAVRKKFERDPYLEYEIVALNYGMLWKNLIVNRMVIQKTLEVHFEERAKLDTEMGRLKNSGDEDFREAAELVAMKKRLVARLKLEEEQEKRFGASKEDYLKTRLRRMISYYALLTPATDKEFARQVGRRFSKQEVGGVR